MRVGKDEREAGERKGGWGKEEREDKVIREGRQGEGRQGAGRKGG